MTVDPTPGQAEADPIPVVLAYLREHPETPGLLGGPEHISGIIEAPWPRLTVDLGVSSDLRRLDLNWDAQYEIAFELLGHPGGAPGKAGLFQIALRILRILGQLPNVQVVDEFTPVVSRVDQSGAPAWTPKTSGQPAYQFSVLLTIRPPRSMPLVFDTP